VEVTLQQVEQNFRMGLDERSSGHTLAQSAYRLAAFEP
jgi:hypothetical protein